MTNEWFRRAPAEPKYAHRFGGVLVIALCLALPSIWMLAKIPPLWKDVDAYIQVTARPGFGTILHYGPLYNFLARLPLYLGFACDSLRAGLPLPPLSFLAEPTLCDSGVFLLIALQHAALLYASCALIFSATKLFLPRLGLAILWALNPLFYTFAHCVGSETLSLILLILLARAGLELHQPQRRFSWQRWSLFALLLFLSLLTRHINLVLAALLPLAFALDAALRFGGALRQRSPRLRRALFYRTRKDLHHTLMAMALGVVCLALSQLTLRVLCRAAGIPFYSRIGYTFMWRAQSLANLSATDRARVIDQGLANTQSPEVRIVLDLLRSITGGSGKLDPLQLMEKERALLRPEIADKEFCEVLNGATRALLLPPSPPFLALIWSDFAAAQKSTIPSVARHLVRATGFYFTQPESMPLCANLATFRGRSRAEILGLPLKHPYLRLWKNLSHDRLLTAWLASLLALAFLARARAVALLVYAIVLTFTGLLLMLANCFLTELIPRFTMPMWTLTIVSTTLLLGSAAQSLQLAWRKRKSAGQRVS